MSEFGMVRIRSEIVYEYRSVRRSQVGRRRRDKEINDEWAFDKSFAVPVVLCLCHPEYHVSVSCPKTNVRER